MYSLEHNKNEFPLVTVYTQVYNTKPYVAQCIESVLSQSFTNFEYILVDNGCTDGCSNILDHYAGKDKRIKLIHYEENRLGFWPGLIAERATGCYLSILDSDDWWGPDYLERLVRLAEETGADVVSTGTFMHVEGTPQISERAIKNRILLDSVQFPDAFPFYHVFFRTVWAKLIRMETYSKAYIPLTEKIKQTNIPYGGDTIMAFAFLRQSTRICLDNSILHHYRIHKKSSSYKYNSRRFFADVYLYNDAIDFLTAYGPISVRNRNFLQIVYSYALIDTLGVIRNAALSPAEKLREYRTIATHPLTLAAYRECKDESAARSRTTLLTLILQAGSALGSAEDVDLRTALQPLLPNCGKAVTGRNLPLFLQDQTLLRYFLEDDADSLVQQLLTYISANQYAKKYDLANVVQILAADNPLLCQIGSIVFLRKYSGLYLSVWRGETLSALEKMTGLLLENQVTRGKETFLQLYISLAALEEQVPAFVFGKFQLAKLYLRQGKENECRAVVEELTEMGLDDGELSQLRRELEEQP